ncbi:MAG: alpha/beta hydrolase [Clostridia bacterium]|nr:alpha/beta hydrolase [Clostridia bacterium]
MKVITVIMLITIALLAYSAFVGWKLIHPKRRAIPVFSLIDVPSYEDVSFKDISKTLNLKGWYFSAGGSDKTVILCHGYKMNRLIFKERTFNLIKDFNSRGYNVLTFDFRNAGTSEGTFTSIGLYEKDDILGAIDYVKSRGSRNIVLMGFSMGASSSLLAASESSDVDAVIEDSGFSDLKNYLDKQLPVWSRLPSFPFSKLILFSIKSAMGLDPAHVSPRKVMHKIAPRPVLFIHSKDDTYISVENGRKLYNVYSKLAADNAVYWETQGADHLSIYWNFPEEYIKKVFDFLENKVYGEHRNI